MLRAFRSLAAGRRRREAHAARWRIGRHARTIMGMSPRRGRSPRARDRCRRRAPMPRSGTALARAWSQASRQAGRAAAHQAGWSSQLVSGGSCLGDQGSLPVEPSRRARDAAAHQAGSSCARARARRAPACRRPPGRGCGAERSPRARIGRVVPRAARCRARSWAHQQWRVMPFDQGMSRARADVAAPICRHQGIAGRVAVPAGQAASPDKRSCAGRERRRGSSDEVSDSATRSGSSRPDRPSLLNQRCALGSWRVSLLEGCRRTAPSALGGDRWPSGLASMILETAT